MLLILVHGVFALMEIQSIFANAHLIDRVDTAEATP